MGLRVALYTPEETSDDAASGVVGFMVVLARRNAMTPDTLKATPMAAIARATEMRASAGAFQDGVARETPHMTIATNATTAGGGIFSSRDCMLTLMAPDDEVERREHVVPANEADLFGSSNPSLAPLRCNPRSLEPLVRQWACRPV